MHNIEFKKEIVYKRLKERILSGELTAGQKLPKELDFSKELGVAKVTLRSALTRLEADGLVARLPSKGTFVLPVKRTSTCTLLVLSSEMEHKESPNWYILPEIKKSAYKQGIEIESLNIDYIEGLSSDEIKKICDEKNIPAIILLSSGFLGHEPVISKLKGVGLPVILPHGNETDTERTGFASIVVLERKAWKEAVSTLVSFGHKRIGALGLTRPGSQFRGYSLSEHLELLRNCGADGDEVLIKTASYNRVDARIAVEELMALDIPPTAILCYSDFLAIFVYEALKALDVLIPKDVSVMGFCGYPGGAFLNPPLTTIDLEYAKMAEKSVELALSSLKWEKEDLDTPVVIKKHKLLIRRSVAAVADVKISLAKGA